jgi:O-antigen ligase
MARLAHNDYLEQFSDSGIPGGLAYTAWICLALWTIGKKLWPAHEPQHLLSMNPSASSPRPSPPLPMEERVAEGRRSGEEALRGSGAQCATRDSMNSLSDPLHFALYAGLLAWFAQGLGEFSLYIPALAWLAFTLLGSLAGADKPFDNPTPIE